MMLRQCWQDKSTNQEMHNGLDHPDRAATHVEGKHAATPTQLQPNHGVGTCQLAVDSTDTSDLMEQLSGLPLIPNLRAT
jgi:hypothetical protein